MKIAAFVTTLLALSPLSQAASLRSKDKGTTKTTTKAQLIVHGVRHAFSDQDLAIINESAITAFNGVQKSSGYSLKTIKPLIHFGVNENLKGCSDCPPDDDSFVADLKMCSDCPPDDDFLQQLKGCSDCPPDDDALALKDSTANALLVEMEMVGCSDCPPDDDAMVGCSDCPPDDDAVSPHVDFVHTFCRLLAKSGSSNLVLAHHCTISFLGEPGHKVDPIKMLKRDDESALGFISVKGLLHDLTTKDLAIIEKNSLETYKEAFGWAGRTMDSLHVRAAVETPKSNKSLPNGCSDCPPDDDSSQQLVGCSDCPPDDDSFLTHGIYNIVMLDAKVAGLKSCSDCPPDDDAVALDPTDMKKANKAFSKALCAKLRNSGSPNLVFADGCALHFFYEHEEKESQK